MAYRNDHDAALARVATLEAEQRARANELEMLRADNARLLRQQRARFDSTGPVEERRAPVELKGLAMRAVAVMGGALFVLILLVYAMVH